MERLRHPQLLKCSRRAGAGVAAPGHRASRAAPNQQRRPATKTWTSLGPLIRPIFHSSPKDPTTLEICGPFPIILSAAKWDKVLCFKAKLHICVHKEALGPSSLFGEAERKGKPQGRATSPLGPGDHLQRSPGCQ